MQRSVFIVMFGSYFIGIILAEIATSILGYNFFRDFLLCLRRNAETYTALLMLAEFCFSTIPLIKVIRLRITGLKSTPKLERLSYFAFTGIPLCIYLCFAKSLEDETEFLEQKVHALAALKYKNLITEEEYSKILTETLIRNASK